MELPNGFLEQMKCLLGEEYPEYLESFSRPAHSALRVNTGKIPVREFLEKTGWDLRPVPWVSNGFYYRAGKSTGEDASNPAKHPFYYAGLYYLQEPSAMTPASRLPVEPGDRVMDLCAAPGGKATELAARLQGRGMLLANDISNSRARALLKNLELQGVENMLVTSEDPERLVQAYPEYFDKILLDAPCSGEGMFRKEHSMIAAWRERGPSWYAPIQRELIRQARQMLRPGGYLLYSTCTFSLEENEKVIDDFLEEYPDMELCPVEPYEGFAPGVSVGAGDLSACVHIYPHRMEGEGHFLALMKKQAAEPCCPGPDIQRHTAISNEKLPETRKGKRKGHEGGKIRREKKRKSGETAQSPAAMLAAAEEFLAHTRRDWKSGKFFCRQDQVYYLPDGLEPAEGLRYLRTGLWVGTVKNGRFEPSQALAMALRAEQFDAVLDLASEDERTIRYLKGETIPLGKKDSAIHKGWVLVCVDGFPLGFGKAAGATVKNKYYAGWRMV